jgi:hypothetical protein
MVAPSRAYAHGMTTIAVAAGFARAAAYTAGVARLLYGEVVTLTDLVEGYAWWDGWSFCLCS